MSTKKDTTFGEAIREGTRGGLEQFKWDDIKGEALRDRECYLGQSTRVGLMGKFGRYKKNDWWFNTADDPDAADGEVKRVQNYENEIMQEAIGVKPKFLLLSKAERAQAEMEELATLDREKTKKEDGLPTARKLAELTAERDSLNKELTELKSRRRGLEGKKVRGSRSCVDDTSKREAKYNGRDGDTSANRYEGSSNERDRGSYRRSPAAYKGIHKDERSSSPRKVNTGKRVAISPPRISGGDRKEYRVSNGDRERDRRHNGDREGDRRYNGDREGDRRYNGDREGDRRYNGDREGDRRYNGKRSEEAESRSSYRRRDRSRDKSKDSI